jgi:[acyl-carrier-protein] S-malonyltransferase
LPKPIPAVRALFDQADTALGYSLTNVMFEGPMEELTKTSRCQPALYAHGLAILEVLKSKVPSLEIAATAGLSLGEFTAHAAAGTFDFATGLNLVFQRGSFMEEACENTKGAMLASSAVRNPPSANSPPNAMSMSPTSTPPAKSFSAAAPKASPHAASKAKDKGIKRAIPLPVAGAYHSRLMKSAQDKLAAVLAAAPIQSPRVPVVCNFEARPVSTPEEIRSTLTSQVTGSVRWVESMQHLIAAGHTLFIELGPDATLAGLMGKIDKSVKVISIKDAATLDAAVACHRRQVLRSAGRRREERHRPVLCLALLLHHAALHEGDQSDHRRLQ